MIVRTHRCKHCQSPYQYHASGHWMPKFNNKDYCPSCWEKISALLETIPVVRKEVWLPTEMTGEEFDAKMVEEKARQEAIAAKDNSPNIWMGHMVFQILGWGTGMTASHLTVNMCEYRKVHASHTNQDLVELRYELDVPSGEIVGLWGLTHGNHYAKVTKELWAEREKQSKAWYKANEAPPKRVEAWPMEPPVDIPLYLKAYHSESAADILVKYAQEELKKELK